MKNGKRWYVISHQQWSRPDRGKENKKKSDPPYWYEDAKSFAWWMLALVALCLIIAY